MHITKSNLKKIIKEETQKILQEWEWPWASTTKTWEEDPNIIQLHEPGFIPTYQTQQRERLTDYLEQPADLYDLSAGWPFPTSPEEQRHNRFREEQVALERAEAELMAQDMAQREAQENER